jgi:CubicO group peptidase (beta-lactamase class C family)
MALDLNELAFQLVIRRGAAPAAALAVAFRQDDAWRVCTGYAGVRSPSQRQALRADSPFDLASVSKPFVAVTLVRLARAGRLALQSPLATLLPELGSSASAACTLEQLLSHRAGLEAHLPLFQPLLDKRAVCATNALWTAACARRQHCAAQPGAADFPPLYSDLGYILAGAAAERHTGRPLDALVAEEVMRPLGLRVGSARQWLAEDRAFGARVVPSEVVSWRGGELTGVVHDDNAWALQGHGLSGQAGLFGDAASVARFGCAMLDALHARQTSWLDQQSAVALVAERSGGPLRLGFDGQSSTGSSTGTRAGPRTFGHLGFTGTSFWCDPEQDVVVVLLTNRVRTGRGPAAIRQLRPEAHDALFAWAEAQKTG